jgi:hypothetical protein
MTGFDELERQLLDRVARRGRRRLTVRSWPAVWHAGGPRRGVLGGGAGLGGLTRGLGAGLVVALVAAVVVLALTSFRHHSAHPGRGPVTGSHHLSAPPGSRYPSVAVRDYFAAMDAAGKRDRGCVGTEGTISDVPPDPALVSVLRVLAGPPSGSVPLPPWLHGVWLQSARQDVFRPLADGINIRYVRLARVADGMYFYITPAAQIPPPPPPARCYSEAMTILRARTRTLPRAERDAILTQAQQMTGFARRSAKLRPPRPAICFSALGPNHSGPERCGAWAGLIKTHGIFNGGSVAHGVVPNGVASVTLEYRTSQPGQTANYAGNIVNNVFAIKVARSDARISAERMIWRSASGAVIKVIPEKG